MEHLRITVGGKVYDVVVEKIDSEEPDSLTSSAQSVRSVASAQVPLSPAPAKAAPANPGDVVSPLAGIVKAVEVTPGSKVSEGDPVVTLEAMKMYTEINAASSGTVTSVYVKVGDAVAEGQPLYAID